MGLSRQHQTKAQGVFYLMIAIFFAGLWGNGEVIAHGWKAPEEAAAMKNAVPMDKDSIDAGKEVYTQFCGACHGQHAQGDSRENAGTQTDPPDLRQRLKNHSDGDFFWKIQNGNNDMPAFEEDLQENDIWSVINYLRTLID